jgi:hypothetical protein
MLDALREFRGSPPLDSEAIQAYERVLQAGEYTAETGACWTFRRVLDHCGRAAAEAFLAAGGHHAFASSWRESERRERFLAAYRQFAREMPASRLLPAAPAERAQIAAAPVTQDQAEAVVNRLAGMVMRKCSERGRHLTDAEWESRKAELIRQARTIEARDGAPKEA